MLDRLYITIDTEPDCDISWRRTNPLQFTSVTDGIEFFYRPIWDRLSVNPIYFVSPEVLADAKSCTMLKSEIKKGAIIGSHLHSEYIGPDLTFKDGAISTEFPCFAHSDEVEHTKIDNLTKLIRKKLGVKPEWYRAARFGADLGTIRILKDLGYKYDSSVTPHVSWEKSGGPDHSSAPEQPYWISKTDLYKPAEEKKSIGVMEVPVTLSGKRFGFAGRFFPDSWLFYRWLRPTHMSVFEQKKLADEYFRKYKDPVFVMMFHSMEVMPGKSPYVRNSVMQKMFLSRIEKVAEYILSRK